MNGFDVDGRRWSGADLLEELAMFDLTQTQLIALVVVAVLVVVALIAMIVMARSARERHERLAERFGPEYDRTVEAASKRRDAERDLQARLDRHDGIATHPIGPGRAEHFAQRLDDLQARFVDAPAAAVVATDGLLADIAVAAGYPDGSIDELLGDLSVDHPVAVAEHRRSQDAARRSGKQSPSTEQLRTALVSSRRVCEALLAPSSASRAGSEHHDDARSDAEHQPGTGSEDHVLELPEHEQVGQRDRRTATGAERPGEGLLGPDGRSGR